MKSKILKILAENSELIHSGEKLSEKLGVSRVSIWKHIKKLQQLGYRIESSANGYQLLSFPDALYAWEFPQREANIHYFHEVDSTMTVARKLAHEGCPHFTVVIAEQQNAGRGRLTRTWHSEGGGLYFTIILRPLIPPQIVSRYGFAASLVLARTLQIHFGIDARVKWPNDILVNEKKLCGMLSEMEVVDEQVSFLNIGIGINVNNNPIRKEPNSVSIGSLLGESVPRKKVLTLFLDAFEKEIRQATLDHVLSDWKKFAITLGREVTIVTTKETLEGRTVDIDDIGALILELKDGTVKKVYYGDCFHQP
ncbi:MAG: biotin--[acetyl-CoA-carboxylase] ligase [SAR324 cluster bacterium]|nr:biotin--[acetyl-CoA-carboxylase] ligase [SAR324 cluster bacterium]